MLVSQMNSYNENNPLHKKYFDWTIEGILKRVEELQDKLSRRNMQIKELKKIAQTSLNTPTHFEIHSLNGLYTGLKLALKFCQNYNSIEEISKAIASQMEKLDQQHQDILNNR